MTFVIGNDTRNLYGKRHLSSVVTLGIYVGNVTGSDSGIDGNPSTNPRRRSFPAKAMGKRGVEEDQKERAGE